MHDKSNFNNADGRFLSSQDANPWIRTVNRFLYSPLYMVLVALITLLANVCGREMIAYTAIIAICLYTVLFCRDMLPIMPFFICGYISPSLNNNPGKNSSSIFFPSNGGLVLLGMLILVLLALILRFSLDKSLRTKLFSTPRRLWLGMAMLAAAYLLSGIGIENYEEIYKRNLLFAAVQIFSVAGLYWFFSGAVYWERVPQNFFAWIGMLVGLVLLAELGYIYLTAEVLIEGVIDRANIYTGWGMHNNIGGLLSMMVPFPYYFASQSKKHAWCYHFLGLLMIAGVFTTNSRGSILAALIVYILCMIMVLWKAKSRLHNAIAYGITAIAVLGVLIAHQDAVTQIFNQIIELGLSTSGRDQIYLDGLHQFLQFPVFGGSFFPLDFLRSWSENAGFVNFFPPRWHNTIVQIAASCGAVGLIAYCVHRVQTVILFLKKDNRVAVKRFIGLSLLVLLGTSLVDCHFFNVGPVFFYSMALAFVEHCPAERN